jgi:FixJ family two-component response regulator
MKMPNKNGLYVQQKLQERSIEIPVIFLSGQSFPNEIIASMKNGAFDFLLKPFDVDALLTAVSNALSFNLIQHELSEDKSQTLKDFEALTKREKEVYALINSGLPSIDIAAQLDISPRTIKAHKAQIMEKMNADSPQDLLKKWLSIHK